MADRKLQEAGRVMGIASSTGGENNTKTFLCDAGGWCKDVEPEIVRVYRWLLTCDSEPSLSLRQWRKMPPLQCLRHRRA